MIIKTAKELQALREGGRILGRVLHEVAQSVKPGMTTESLDALAERRIVEYGGIPSFKGYRVSGVSTAYPATLCVSINEEVVHGIPSDRVLQDGDVVGLDVGMKYNGFYTDTAMTVIVGARRSAVKRLVQSTKAALEIGIKQVRMGAHVGDIGHAIQTYLEGQGLSVVRELVGHGVGKTVHEDPEIPNWGKNGTGPELVEGEVIALEPMATLGGYKVKLLKDGWTWVTRDKSVAAHFEHTLVVTKNGAEVITKP